MPDLANRTAHEDRIAQGLIAVFGDIEHAMLHRPDALDWQAYRKRVEDACIAALLLIYLAGVDGFSQATAQFAVAPASNPQSLDFQRSANAAGSMPAGSLAADALEIPAARIQDRAVVYADQVGKTMAAELMDAMQVKAVDLLRAFKSGEITREEFEAMTKSLADPARANTIAATETTRANTAAEQWAQNQQQAQGAKRLTSTWNTERDGRVCPVCAPLHGRTDAGWQSVIPAGPPAHPNCRCFLTYKPFDTPVTA